MKVLISRSWTCCWRSLALEAAQSASRRPCRPLRALRGPLEDPPRRRVQARPPPRATALMLRLLPFAKLCAAHLAAAERARALLRIQERRRRELVEVGRASSSLKLARRRRLTEEAEDLALRAAGELGGGRHGGRDRRGGCWSKEEEERTPSCSSTRSSTLGHVEGSTWSSAPALAQLGGSADARTASQRDSSTQAREMRSARSSLLVLSLKRKPQQLYIAKGAHSPAHRTSVRRLARPRCPLDGTERAQSGAHHPSRGSFLAACPSALIVHANLKFGYEMAAFLLKTVCGSASQGEARDGGRRRRRKGEGGTHRPRCSLAPTSRPAAAAT